MAKPGLQRCEMSSSFIKNKETKIATSGWGSVT